jgi:hypothetical protein
LNIQLLDLIVTKFFDQYHRLIHTQIWYETYHTFNDQADAGILFQCSPKGGFINDLRQLKVREATQLFKNRGSVDPVSKLSHSSEFTRICKGDVFDMAFERIRFPVDWNKNTHCLHNQEYPGGIGE